MRYIDWVLPLNLKFFLIKNLKKITNKEFIKLEQSVSKGYQNPMLSKNKELNNSVCDNKTCFILACGPSINEMDLSRLNGKDCISVSNFFVHPIFNELKPKFHVFAPIHEPITDEQFINWLKDYELKSLFNQKVFCHIDFYSKIKNNKILTNKEVVFYGVNNSNINDFNNFSLTDDFPTYQTVVHLAIYIAISLGYKEINLLGVDHSWLFNFGKTVHFYSEEQSALFTSNYNEHELTDLEDQFKNHQRLWYIYKLIKNYCSNNNIKIFNCTPNSFLDVFEKKNKF
jgi:hypothetical protein